jgi:hypothetical protein
MDSRAHARASLSSAPSAAPPPEIAELKVVGAALQRLYMNDPRREEADEDMMLVANTLASLQRDAERMREALTDLRFVGGQLANCAFNLAQDEALRSSMRETLDTCRKQWDALTEKHVAALSPIRQPEKL